MPKPEYVVMTKHGTPAAAFDATDVIAVHPYKRGFFLAYFSQGAKMPIKEDKAYALMKTIHNDRTHTFQAKIGDAVVGILRVEALAGAVDDASGEIYLKNGTVAHAHTLFVKGLLQHLQAQIDAKPRWAK